MSRAATPHHVASNRGLSRRQLSRHESGYARILGDCLNLASSASDATRCEARSMRQIAEGRWASVASISMSVGPRTSENGGTITQSKSALAGAV